MLDAEGLGADVADTLGADVSALPRDDNVSIYGAAFVLLGPAFHHDDESARQTMGRAQFAGCEKGGSEQREGLRKWASGGTFCGRGNPGSGPGRATITLERTPRRAEHGTALCVG